ncbi:MobF family relaxase [Sinomonas sp. G460-2]|uniref:MobF family relaxase n=1 Tax=Sinomonas sp. G460-2 TaxID=3393464 RepID=UPI0039EE1C7E
MRGGVTLFRGDGAAARRYVESDRSRADDYYLGEGTVAEFVQLDRDGEVMAIRDLAPEAYAAWVDWAHPITGEQLGIPRRAGDGRLRSPRFAEMVVNAPKSLSIAAALHPEVSAALDAAQQDAAAEIRRWLARHSVTRVGARGAQEVVPVEELHTVAVAHRTSRAGDPHRHIHLQIGARVRAAGAWRALDTAALFAQQGAIRALGTAVIAAHPVLAEVLDRHGLTLDPVTGEVGELRPFNAVMSKRAAQVERNLDRLTTEWEAAHPGETPGPVVTARLQAKAWAHGRPAKKPTSLAEEAAWIAELREGGYDPATLKRSALPMVVALDDISVEEIASRALDRCAARASAWTMHTVAEHITHLVTEYGVRAAGEELGEFVALATRLALEDCLSLLPPGAPAPEHVAHLTSVTVIGAETRLRDLLAARAKDAEPEHPGLGGLAQADGLDTDQREAAAAVASADPLVVVEGAAGAGKTTMLAAAIAASEREGRRVRVVAPTNKAAQVAAEELGVPADSVAALVHAHGWRWNDDGVWTRLARGAIDPETGRACDGPPADARIGRGERIVVDEAGMLDQDTALALFTLAMESGASVALVGDRAQLPAVGRGGVLDMAAQIRGRTWQMTSVHRFADPAYADLTLAMRDGSDPGAVFDQLTALGLVRIHASTDDAQTDLAGTARDGDAITIATIEEATALNERIRARRVEQGVVDGARTATGSDGLSIGSGDLIQTRRNDARLGVANRQIWTVQQVDADGSLWVREAGSGRRRNTSVRLPADYVAEHAHLSYAATAYGVQGTTATASHTLLTDQTSAAAVYVGMTRGRQTNLLHVVAENLADTREQFVAAMERDRADRGLTEATERAREAVTDLVADGPVALVNAECARLRERAEHAEREAARWERALAVLARQVHQHDTEQERQEQIVNAAGARVARALAQAVPPLVQQATTDGGAYLVAQARMWGARRAQSGAGGFRKRVATWTLKEATAVHDNAERATRDRWHEVPNNKAGLSTWAQAVAGREADTDPRVIETRCEAEKAHHDQLELTHRHNREHAALSRRLLGGATRSAVAARAGRLRKEAAQDRRDLSQLETLPTAQAAQLVHNRAALAGAQRLAIEQARQAAEAPARLRESPTQQTARHRSSPSRDIRPSL